MHQNMLIPGLANNCMGIEPVKKRIYKKPEIKKCGKLENAGQPVQVPVSGKVYTTNTPI
jgi:hypothetical protein